MNSNGIVELDKRGDLILRFGATNDLRVCSRTVARSSVVFEKMLFGPFKESKKEDKEWIVELPDDDILPMSIILAMAHGCHKIVPSHVPIPELFGLLVLGDKYGMTHLFCHYLHRWLPAANDVEFGDDTVMIAWIARAIGAKELFEKAIIEIAKHCHSESEVGPFTGDKDIDLNFHYHIMASEIMDVVAETRTSLLKAVLKPLREGLAQALDVRACKIYNHRETIACSNSLLGSLMRGCKSADIDLGVTCLTDSTPAYPNSVNNLCWAVQLMRCDNTLGHDVCNPMGAIRTETMRAFGNPTVVMSLSQQEYLEKQAAISGWYEAH
ncbi:hypothetical protein LX32DRAFT_706265 [Colletotrichum zoysiae]|uniref:BTB domain-containing protein n=1 Tax=Colletotrichum zoysiae TaxID=1216348 RepID=A0AAD9LZU0_9PEZI|nr:hypothetical protein LX32DRAFT_706265 [Colletotrichum zoysiae]